MSTKVISNLTRALSNYDAMDILAKIGGLCLLPDNASHAIRLEALTHAAACNKVFVSKPQVSLSNFSHIVQKHLGKHTEIARLEDPCENMFTEAFTFYGGSYIVFPSIMESPSFILRNICKGLFLAKSKSSNSTMLKRARLLITAVLAVSNDIAKRAKLDRGIEPSQHTWNEEIVIPPLDRLRELQQAVVFEKRYLKVLLSTYNLPEDVLDPLIIMGGSLAPSNYDSSSSPCLMHPIVDVGESVIVPMPGLLIESLIHNLHLLAIQNNSVSETASIFRIALWDSVCANLDLLRIEPIQLSARLPNLKNADFVDGFFNIDSDKLLYVQMISDNFSDFDPQKPIMPWRTSKNTARVLQQRSDEVIESIFESRPSPNEILNLLIIQPFGRPHFLSLRNSRLQYDVPFLALPAADLETISYLERGDPLALWKYIRHKNLIRKRTSIFKSNELDEFALYRGNRHSYYISDEAKPDHISITPGGSGDLRRRVYREIDRHGVLSPQGDSIMEVIHLHSPDIPIYSQQSSGSDSLQIAFLIEQYPMNIWVTGSKYPEDTTTAPEFTYLLFADMISYWIWQFAPSLCPILEAYKGYIDNIVIRFHLSPSGKWDQPLPEDWQNNCGDIVKSLKCTVDSKESTILLEVGASILGHLARPDNYAEREIMVIVLDAIGRLLAQFRAAPDVLNDTAIRSILNIHAPLGIKKKLLILPHESDPSLDNRQIPDFRKIQEPDEQWALEDIGNYIKSKGLISGQVAEGERARVLNEVVHFLYSRLENIVASLNPVGLLEALIAYNESISYETSHRHLTTPTRLACFHDEPAFRKIVAEEIPQVEQAALASRFLIEYVAARPPTGLRPSSLEVYDKLMAISSLIIAFGGNSDAVTYDIADVSVRILPSGRLGLIKPSYDHAIRNFMLELSAGRIKRATDFFERYWEDSRIKIPKLDKEFIQFESAFNVEFGFTVREFAKICGEVMNIGDNQSGPVKAMLIPALVDELRTRTGYPVSKIEVFLHQFALEPRDDFLNPFSGRKEDVYPWRMNREFSYIRRPFIKKKMPNGEEMLWGNRHLWHSNHYLIDLCSSGKLRAKRDPMKIYLCQKRSNDSRQFEDEVGEAFHSHGDLIIRKRIKKFKGIKMLDADGNDLGDIDVLVANPVRKEMLLIECKDLNSAVTPYDMKNEIQELFKDEGKHTCAATKQQKRSSWIEENMSIVTQELSLLDEATSWVVRPLIVLSEELVSPYMRRSSVMTLSSRQLEQDFLPGWL